MADRRMVDRRKTGVGTRQDRARRPGRVRGRAVSSRHAAADAQILAFKRRNWILMGTGVLAVLAGFGSLAAGSITLAPILLLAGYLVLIPMGLVAGSFGDPGDDPASGAREEVSEGAAGEEG